MKNKIFYGWYIVLAGFIFITYNSALFIYGFTAFINPIVATFGWSMTEISLATSISILLTVAFNPFIGTIIDRHDPKILMIIGVIVSAIGIFMLSRTVNLAMYYAGFIIMGLGGSFCTGMIQMATISRWFKKDLGKATGVYYMGMAFGGVLVPVLIIVLDKLGWQTTLMISSIIYLVLGISLAFVYRKRPEDYGMLPDGRKSVNNTDTGIAARGNDEFGVTIKQAIRMRAFWQFNIVIFFQQSILGAVTMFIVPYLTNEGISRTGAGTIVSVLTILSMLSRVPLGIMVDRFQKKYIVIVSLSLICVGLFIYWLINGSSPYWLILLFGIIYGLGIGGINVLRPPILVEYFGTKHFGAIFGLSSIAGTISTVSQPFTGWIFDTFQSYKPCWLILIICSLVSIILMATMPKARNKALDR